jgi:hypothetical protein
MNTTSGSKLAEINLPSIAPYITATEMMGVRFVKPQLGTHLKTLLESETPISPGTTVTGVRRLSLNKGDVIPFHVHFNREKIYLFENEESVRVYIARDGAVRVYRLERNQQMFVIPPRCPHALHCVRTTRAGLKCSIIIVINDVTDPTDIAWEPATDELIKNEHFRR